MSERLLSATLLIGGAAIVLNGLFGRDLRNDVEMPMTEAELADKTPPSKTARTMYIFFGLVLVIYGVFRLFG